MTEPSLVEVFLDNNGLLYSSHLDLSMLYFGHLSGQSKAEFSGIQRYFCHA